MGGHESRNRERWVVRWRAGFTIAAVIVPLTLFLLLERQARRLDALAADGQPVDAVVTAASHGVTYYSYRVDGTEYTWNVARHEAPFAVGAVFRAIYLPEDASLTRPWVDRTLAAREAADNRAFSWKLALFVSSLLFLFAGFMHIELRRLRSGARSELDDPQAYKRRILRTAILVALGAVVIGGLHFRDAGERGESLVPVAIGLVLTVAFTMGAFRYIACDGPLKARERSGRLLLWAAPAAVVVALLLVVAKLFLN